LKTKPRVLLKNGATKLEGEITLLGVVEIDVGGQKVKIDLSKATQITVQATPEIAPVRATIIASVDGKEISRVESQMVLPGSVNADFPVGTYLVIYDGGEKANMELRRDGTFLRTREDKQFSGSMEFEKGKLILKNDEIVEVWTKVSGRIQVEHWWPANTYPKGDPQALGLAQRSKD
jgi:hypothetical protein